MSQTVGSNRKITILSFIAAGTTVTAGILHLTLVQTSLVHNLGQGILFLFGGILQIFWAIPVIKRWGRIWQVIGIVGTVILVILWFSTHLHSMQGPPPGGNPSGNLSRGNMTGSELPRGSPPAGMTMGAGGIPLIEFIQIAFVVLYMALSKMISNRKNKILK